MDWRNEIVETLVKTRLVDLAAKAIAGLAVFHGPTQLASDGALLLLALERYRVADGEYPAGLEALRPGFIDNIPKDPFSGGSLVHKRGENDYSSCLFGADLREGGPQPSGDDAVIHTPRVPDRQIIPK